MYQINIYIFHLSNMSSKHTVSGYIYLTHKIIIMLLDTEKITPKKYSYVSIYDT